jgi:hypothetical protein
MQRMKKEREAITKMWVAGFNRETVYNSKILKIMTPFPSLIVRTFYLLLQRNAFQLCPRCE